MNYDPDFYSLLCELQSAVPGSFESGPRTAAHNRSVGGAPNSAHVQGKAQDLIYDSADEFKRAAKEALSLGFMGIEVDVTNNHLHVDTMPRIWRVVHHGPGQETPLEDWIG